MNTNYNYQCQVKVNSFLGLRQKYVTLKPEFEIVKLYGYHCLV